MITCVVDYQIDPGKIDDFERFARAWMMLVERHGGIHHGYFLPAEGAADEARALFSFESLAAYERYRSRFGSDPDFIATDRIRDDSGCVLRYRRTFMRPLLPAHAATMTDSFVAAAPTQVDDPSGPEERSEDFHVLLGRLQEIQSQVERLGTKLEELDGRTKDL